MTTSGDLFVKKFNDLVLEWARLKFAEELQSGFERAQEFDGTRSKELLSILRRQNPAQIEVLAKVLPLRVFWEHPQELELRAQLPQKEREAVEKFRADYDQEHREHFTEHVQRLARANDKEVKEQFKTASRKGKQMTREIGSQWKWEIAGAGAGEWGLVFLKSGMRTTVSLNLARNMSLSYSISMSDIVTSRSVRFHDNYLGVLGLGGGAWEIATVDQFPEKLLKASEFARWHVQEYEKILERVGQH